MGVALGFGEIKKTEAVPDPRVLTVKCRTNNTQTGRGEFTHSEAFHLEWPNIPEALRSWNLGFFFSNLSGDSCISLNIDLGQP